MRFPRIMWLYARNDAADFGAQALQRLALGQGIILDWDDEARHWGSDGATVGQSLRTINPDMTVVAYVRGSFWPDKATMSEDSSPRREFVRRQMVSRGWWAAQGNGQQIRPWPDQPLLSADGIQWLGGYIRDNFDRSYWSGVHVDGMVAEWWHLGAPRAESATMLTAMQGLARTLKAEGIRVQGNGAWAPSIGGFDTASPYAGLIDGAFVEQFPSYPWYDGTGRREPAAELAWGWHMEIGRGWVDAGAGLYLLHAGPLHEHPYFRRFVKTEMQATRLALASSCLLGCWFAPPMRSNPYFCDEMIVYEGATSWDARGRGWLGEPLGEAESGGVCVMREFERGLVVVNPTAMAGTVALEPGMWRRISGWYDKQLNDGRMVDGALTVGAMDAVILWRAGTADERPEQVDEARLNAMEQEMARTKTRLERLERALMALAQGLEA